MDTVGSRKIVEGAYGLGLLYFTRAITDPKAFYCPSVVNGSYAFNTYAEEGWPWPSIPPDYTLGNPYVRCSYNYYPQPKTTEDVATANFGTVTLPELKTQSITLTSPDGYVQSPHPYPVPLKSTDVDQTKAVSGDVLQNMAGLTHRSSGLPGGANVLFADGHVIFITVRANNKPGSRLPFDPRLWDPYTGNGDGPGNDPDAFRIIFNNFQP